MSDGEEIDAEVVEFLAATRKFITDYYGERCPEVSSGCVCCQAWTLYDMFEAYMTH